MWRVKWFDQGRWRRAVANTPEELNRFADILSQFGLWELCEIEYLELGGEG